MSSGSLAGPAPVRIGTRGSPLALAQAALVARALEARGVAVETVVIETAGDRRAADTAWGEGAFVAAIEQALVDGRVDVAVHSAKDVPTREDPRLLISGYLPREEPRDALVLPAGRSGSLATLPAGAVVGTDSPRRTGFLRARRPDLDVRPLHGNVDTRLRRLDDGAADALVLAAAGLVRLGRAERISELLSPDVVPPAPGQGAIAVQVRAGDAAAATLVSTVDDPATRAEVEAERAVLVATGGGCRAPIGALARAETDSIDLVAGAATLDGRTAVVRSTSGTTADRFDLARSLGTLIVDERSRRAGWPRVLLTRAENESRALAADLAELGIAGVVVPAIEIELLDGDPAVAAALANPRAYDLVIVTSVNAVHAVARIARRLSADLNTLRWAAVGKATAGELVTLGAEHVWVPSAANGEALAMEVPLDGERRVLRLRGDIVDETLAEALRERGARVVEATVYRTLVGPAASRALLEAALARDRLEAVVLASPSAVRGLLSLAEAAQRTRLLMLPAVVIGPVTEGAARAAGFRQVAVAPEQSASAIRDLLAGVVGTDGNR